MKIKIYNLVLLAMYVVQIVLFMIFANGGFKAVSAGIVCVETIGLILSFRINRDSKLFIASLVFHILCLLVNLAMTLIYVPTTSQIPLAIFIITLLVTVTILVKIVLDLCIKK